MFRFAQGSRVDPEYVLCALVEAVAAFTSQARKVVRRDDEAGAAKTEPSKVAFLDLTLLHFLVLEKATSYEKREELKGVPREMLVRRYVKLIVAKSLGHNS